MRFFDFLKGPDINRGVKEYSTTDGAVLLDVRTTDEYRQGHIPERKNITLQYNDNFHIIVPPFLHKRKSRLCSPRWYNPSASH